MLRLMIISLFFLPFIHAENEDISLASKECRESNSTPSYMNPLKDLSSFTFFLFCPIDSQETSNKVEAIAMKALEKIGTATKATLLVDEDTIDLSSMNNDAILTYEIEEIETTTEEKLNLMKTSLKLSSHVVIEKTKKTCSPYIWTSSCFIKGNLNENVEENVKNSLNTLLNDFIKDYSKINPNKKPTFAFFPP